MCARRRARSLDLLYVRTRYMHSAYLDPNTHQMVQWPRSKQYHGCNGGARYLSRDAWKSRAEAPLETGPPKKFPGPVSFCSTYNTNEAIRSSLDHTPKPDGAMEGFRS